MRPTKNVARRDDDKKIHFKFVCECEECGAEGDLTLLVKDGMKPFNCPERCGAVYAPWKNPLHLGRWELKAVVLPVFGVAR